jgi:PEGA domain
MTPLSGPALGRDQLLRVLALPKDAPESAIRSASRALSDWLEGRKARLGPEAHDESSALAQELADLTQSTAWWTRGGATPAATRTRAEWRRLGSAVGIVAALACLMLLIAYAAGYRVSRMAPDEEPALYTSRARVFIDGKLPGATLQVFDSDRAEVLAEQPAEGAQIDLEPGRYALEVRREDCPEAWTRSVFLEPDSVQRYAPAICEGHGQLVVRANTETDRLRIDDYDVGHTGIRAHRLTVGDHTIRVDKTGFRPFEARVRIRADEAVELRADLTPLGEAEAKAGRPMPVTKVAPSRAPAAAAQGFSKQELMGAIEAPQLEPADLGLPKRGDFLAREGLPAMPDGGSTAWHDRVAGELRQRFDRDGSGEIDRLDESEAISCSVWQEIERDFKRGGLGLSMAHYFGFDGSQWHPGALSVSRAHRSAVYAKMRECGLEA